MKTARARSVSSFTVLILACSLLACGATELRPELQAHVDKYERLIETYEVKFAAVRGDHPQFAKVSDSYAEELQVWLKEFDTVAPTMSDTESLAVKARIDKLNRRAERMLMGG